jgi:hypothetical integral membrane protein (TIGR02206 family)
MDIFAGPEYTGPAFHFLDATHLIAVAVILVINLGLVAFRGRISDPGRLAIRYGLAALLIINEALWHWWNWKIGMWSMQYMLPLHVCNLLVFISAFTLVTKNYHAYEFIYFMGLCGATQMLVTPDPGQFGFPHIRYFMVFIAHGGIATAAIYMTIVEGCRPHWKSLLWVAIAMNLYIPVILWVNARLGSNYLFIAFKPPMPTLIDYLGPWPWYILSMEGIGLACCLLLYLPFFMRDRKHLRIANEEMRIVNS